MKHNELEKLILKDIKSGMLVREVAKKYGKKKSYVYNLCYDNHLTILRGVRYNILKVVGDLFDINIKYKDIASKYGITIGRVGQIYQLAKEAGIPGIPIRTKGRSKIN